MKHIAVMAQWGEDFREAIEEYRCQEPIPDDALDCQNSPYVVVCGDTTYHQIKDKSQLDCIRGKPLYGVIVSEEIRDILSANEFDYLYEHLKRKVDQNETT